MGKVDKKEEIVENEEVIEEVKEVDENVKKIEELTNQVKELENKNMRLSADMINTIRRKEEENVRMLKYASEGIILELLTVCDNFERALVVEGSEEIKNYMQGMKMIYDSIKKILETNEVTEIDAVGKDFDPSLHHAVMTDHIEGKKDNEVIEVLQKGYIYKDKVIRPAMVKVNK